MDYIVKINDETTQAKSIINLLKTFANDYDFIEFFEDIEDLPELTVEEFRKRHKYSVNNIEEGLTINEMESKIYSKK